MPQSMLALTPARCGPRSDVSVAVIVSFLPKERLTVCWISSIQRMAACAELQVGAFIIAASLL